jgi:hypothetical protein
MLKEQVRKFWKYFVGRRIGTLAGSVMKYRVVKRAASVLAG